MGVFETTASLLQISRLLPGEFVRSVIDPVFKRDPNLMFNFEDERRRSDDPHIMMVFITPGWDLTIVARPSSVWFSFPSWGIILDKPLPPEVTDAEISAVIDQMLEDALHEDRERWDFWASKHSREALKERVPDWFFATWEYSMTIGRVDVMEGHYPNLFERMLKGVF